MSRNKNLGILSAALLVVLISVLAFAPRAYAQNTYKPLHNFEFTEGDGPEQVIMDQAGNLYGAAGQGGGGVGGGPLCGEGCGLVYRLSANSDGSWAETVLYRFCSLKSCADGALPFSPLIFDQAGNLYGETYLGGLYEDGGVFELSPNSDGTWTEKVLYDFTSGADGGEPIGGLTFDQAGNLYGTTYGGGIGYGVVFRLTPDAGGSWTEKVLHDFTFGADGGVPLGGVIIDQAGNLYGTTAYGGVSGSGCGCGVVFELTPIADGSWKEKVLHSFANSEEGGGYPGAGLLLDHAGNLYGTTEQGGNPSQCDGQAVGCGIVFELTPDAGEAGKKKFFTTSRAAGTEAIPLPD